MTNNLEELKKSILEKTQSGDFNKDLFIQLEKEVTKKFFDYELEHSGLEISITDIPLEEEAKEKLKEDFDKAIIPDLVVLIKKIKEENDIKYNVVKVSGSAILNENEESIPFLFSKSKDDEDGIMVEVNKPNGRQD